MKQPVLAQDSSATPFSRSATWPRGNVLWEPEGVALMKEELNRMMDEGLHVPMLNIPKLKDIFCSASASPNFIDDMSRDNHEIMVMHQSLNETTHEEDAFDLADCIAAQKSLLGQPMISHAVHGNRTCVHVHVLLKRESPASPRGKG